MGSRTVRCFSDVAKLWKNQFPQDAGPIAHPVRPHSYIKKLCMARELKSSGCIGLCWRAKASGWYSQVGTPYVKVTSSYSAKSQTYSLKIRCSQRVPATPGQPVKDPMFIPIAVGLLDSNGRDMPLSSLYHNGTIQPIASNERPVFTTILKLTKKEEEFVFVDVLERPVPSLLRGYSAPIRLESDLSDSDLAFLLAQDSDDFNHWESGQLLGRKIMLQLVADHQQSKPLVLNTNFVDGIRSILLGSNVDKEFISKAITLPGEGEIMDMMDVADPDAVHAVREFIQNQIASELKDIFLTMVKENRSCEPYEFNHSSMARQALMKNVCLGYLVSFNTPEFTQLALHEFKTASNMTEQFAALETLAQNPGSVRDEALADFYSKWQHEYLVITKWFALQASSDIPGNVENVRKLLNHPAFGIHNTNMVRSLVGRFHGSLVNFHAKDGPGYKFMGEMVVKLDKTNPQIASGMLTSLTRWRRFDNNRQRLAKAQLEVIVTSNGLSESVFEIASKSLVS